MVRAIDGDFQRRNSLVLVFLEHDEEHPLHNSLISLRSDAPCRRRYDKINRELKSADDVWSRAESRAEISCVSWRGQS